MTTLDNVVSWSDDELFSFASDFHKDCFNFRPRNMVTRSDAVMLINACERWLERMKNTDDGLAQLRADGWAV